jgi:hypothetical protein
MVVLPLSKHQRTFFKLGKGARLMKLPVGGITSHHSKEDLVLAIYLFG